MAMKRTAKRVARTKPKPLGSSSDLPSWEQRLKELKAFKKEHGHCNVPGHYPPNQPLGSWVAFTRSRKKAGKLAEERIRCLEELGFCWALRKRSVFRLDWDVMLAALTAFTERHGHCNVPHTWPEDPRLSWYVKNLRTQEAKRQARSATNRATEQARYRLGTSTKALMVGNVRSLGRVQESPR